MSAYVYFGSRARLRSDISFFYKNDLSFFWGEGRRLSDGSPEWRFLSVPGVAFNLDDGEIKESSSGTRWYGSSVDFARIDSKCILQELFLHDIVTRLTNVNSWRSQESIP